MFLGRQISGVRREGATQIYDRILKIWITIEHVAKFGDERPSDLARRLSSEKKKKEDLNYGGQTEWPAAIINCTVDCNKVHRKKVIFYL